MPRRPTLRAGSRAAAIGAVMVSASLVPPQVAHGEIEVTPSISLSERYDTNVFFVQQSAVPGRELSDYVTTASPSATVELRRRGVSGSLRAGVGLSAYVNNSELNSVSVNGGLSLNLDELVGRVVQRARMSVVDTVQFSPEPPAFLRPDADELSTDPSAVGIRASRADTVRNSATVNLSYPIYRTLNAQGSYTNTMVRFGEQFAPEQGSGLLDTTTHAFTVGLSAQRPRDVVGLNYQESHSETGDDTFTTRGGQLNYSRSLTPTFSGNLNGGFTVVEPSGSLQAVAGASLAWTGELSRAALSYSRSIVPSFAVNATALVSDNVGASFGYSATRNLNLAAGANYAMNRADPDPSVLTFRSVSASLSANYAITRVVSASLSYQYSNFEREQSGRVTSAFDRNVVTLTVSATWN